MQEQAGRDQKINSYKIDIKLLEHVKEKLIDNIPITAIEKGLTVAAFRQEIHSYYVRHEYYNKAITEKRNTSVQPIEFPRIKYDIPADGWYNKKVPQMQKKLQKYNINNTTELIQAVEEYKIIYNSVNQYTSQKDQEIKKLSNQYKLQQKGDINFTPASVVEKMIQYANINHNSKVLEPSAGIGNIADKIKGITNNIDICEQSYSFCELLKLKGFNIVANNFLEYNKQNYYDAIIMNPPFSNNQDITHLKHAYNLLKPNGTLVCITSPHWTFANDKASQNFKEWIIEKNYFTEELPSGTFEMTNVRSQIIVIEKNEEVMQQAI
jgi:phospholipid N-methyltransferase